MNLTIYLLRSLESVQLIVPNLSLRVVALAYVNLEPMIETVYLSSAHFSTVLVCQAALSPRLAVQHLTIPSVLLVLSVGKDLT